MALAVLAVYIAVYVGIDVAGADVSGVACGGAISVQIRTVDLTEVFIVFFATWRRRKLLFILLEKKKAEIDVILKAVDAKKQPKKPIIE